MRIVRLANYVTPASGGLRTALRELGAGYLAAGHEPVLVIPGPRPGRRTTPRQGLVVTVPGGRCAGHRWVSRHPARRSLRRLIQQLAPGPAGGVRPHHAALDRRAGPGTAGSGP